MLGKMVETLGAGRTTRGQCNADIHFAAAENYALAAVLLLLQILTRRNQLSRLRRTVTSHKEHEMGIVLAKIGLTREDAEEIAVKTEWQLRQKGLWDKLDSSMHTHGEYVITKMGDRLVVLRGEWLATNPKSQDKP